MKRQTYKQAVGLSDRAKSYTVEGELLPSPLTDDLNKAVSNFGVTELSHIIFQDQNFTLLDICLWGVDIADVRSPACHDIVISQPSDVVVLAPLGDVAPEPVIYPPPVSKQKISPGQLEVPIFNVRYILRNVPMRVDVRGVALSFEKLRQQFEGNLFCDLLMKMLRSQRNMVDLPAGMKAISSAITIVEMEEVAPTFLLLNPEAIGRVRCEIENSNGRLFGLEPIVFMPNRRNYDRRSYVLPRPEELGICIKSGGTLATSEVGSDAINIELTVAMAVICPNRNVIAAFDN